MVNEETLLNTPQPTPPTSRRRLKRIPIKSAIPLLHTLDQTINDPLPKPTPGTMGKPTQVYVNHFPVSIAPNKMLYQYDAVVEKPGFRSENQWEEVLSRDQRRRFVQKLAENKKFDFVYW